jgi:hypothetical protein
LRGTKKEKSKKKRKERKRKKERKKIKKRKKRKKRKKKKSQRKTGRRGRKRSHTRFRGTRFAPVGMSPYLPENQPSLSCREKRGR